MTLAKIGDDPLVQTWMRGLEGHTSDERHPKGFSTGVSDWDIPNNTDNVLIPNKLAYPS